MAAAIIAAIASNAQATETTVQIEMPVVQASAGSSASGTVKTLDWMTDELRALIHAEATTAAASATGQLGIVDVHKAQSSGNSAAWVESYTQFTVDDPQGRPEVKTILDFDAIASAGAAAPGIVGLTSSATILVMIGRTDGTPVLLRVNNDTLSSEIIHTPQFVSSLFVLSATGQTGLLNDSTLHPVVPVSRCSGGIWMNGQVVSEHPAAEGCSADRERGSLELTHAPGTYVMRVMVSSSFNGLAASDPVWRPHPDNPDVIVTRHSPTGIPAAPLEGTNPDDLVAQGIDPTPFIDAGFFGTPSSEPPPPPPGDGGSEPPPPPAASKYWCGPGFWLKNAVTFGATAWPLSEHTYYDYNSTAGQRAGCPVAEGNPTLLQVLENPKLHFTSKSQGAGFNCVADYLSARGGLGGTAADNNGVCSIDQFGQQIP
jgi:hypothetical protein